MKEPKRRLVCGTSAALLIMLAAGYADEQKVSPEKLPKQVVEAVKGRFNDAVVTGAGKETEDGKLVYEVTINLKGQNIDVTLTPEGEILLIEREIGLKGLPGAVANALEGDYPKATYKIVEEIIKVEKKEERLAYYEALLVTAEKEWLEVQVTSAGKIINKEKKAPHDNEGR